MYTHPLECAPLLKSSRFDLTKEDPQLYANEDLEGYFPSREWPDIPLPKAKPTKPVVVPDEIIEKAKSQHNVMVRWMKSVGVDLCREMEDQEGQHVLESVIAHQKDCSICGKSCHNTQRLRAHIRAQHMTKTPFQCSQCQKYLSDTNCLKQHERTHDPVLAKEFKCSKCPKAFPSKGQLNAHAKRHDPQKNKFTCQYGCGKTADLKKNHVAHEKYCKLNPHRPPKSQCPYCPKDFDRLKDLKKHAKIHHPSRLSSLEADMGL